MKKQEHILEENPNRFVIFPLKYRDICDKYKQANKNHIKDTILNSHFTNLNYLNIVQILIDHNQIFYMYQIHPPLF